MTLPGMFSENEVLGFASTWHNILFSGLELASEFKKLKYPSLMYFYIFYFAKSPMSVIIIISL